MWIYYLAYACIGNSSPRISGAVGDGLAATASVRAPAYATNAGSEYSLSVSNWRAADLVALVAARQSGARTAGR